MVDASRHFSTVSTIALTNVKIIISPRLVKVKIVRENLLYHLEGINNVGSAFDNVFDDRVIISRAFQQMSGILFKNIT
jgi:hypothetical protein